MGTQFLLWSYRNTEIMLGLNQALLGIGLDLLQCQQELMAKAAQQSLLPRPEQVPPADEGFAGFTRLGLEAFERMMAALQFANDSARTVAADLPSAGPRQGG